jgi:pimeloyl-ACP methyl ester carboxylesterase
MTTGVEVDGPWTHRRVAANGARFHVAECGDGPLVVLLHGFPEFWWAWRHQLPALADAGYRAAAMDLRGYAGSDKPPRGYDPFTLAADVAGVVRSLGERTAVLVGHGWGGFVAWAAAVLQRRTVTAIGAVSMPHPLRLRRAMLTDAHQLLAAGHLLRFQGPVLPERRLVANEGALVERLMRQWAAPTSGFPDPEAAAHYRRVMAIWPAPHCALEYHRWVVRSVPRADGRRFARRMREHVRVPVLHVQGELDGAILASSALGSGALVDGPYTWRLLPDVGHFPHEEAPDVFTAELLAWLRGLPA